MGTTQVSLARGSELGGESQRADLEGRKEDTGFTLQDVEKENRIPAWTRGHTRAWCLPTMAIIRPFHVQGRIASGLGCRKPRDQSKGTLQDLVLKISLSDAGSELPR